ncbi:uncharacterized protein LOC107267310 isoform X2 [Cephus cinctus]|uniref:Uncharacterized protein LOC107267310 isoform X2 n=1 Tax=Cephus cinctus TaxID=211228 RepID=A0AAJ7W0X5_CEPCN|nr:uncharacterized protein LOC107267310 isoform X2 [Cephus cinctus]
MFDKKSISIRSLEIEKYLMGRWCFINGTEVRVNGNKPSKGAKEENNVTKWEHILKILLEKDSKNILFLIGYNSLIIYYLGIWIATTNSLALKAYQNTVYFNIFALGVCLISVWVEQNTSSGNKIQPLISSFKLKQNTVYSHNRSRSASGYPEYRGSFATHYPRHSISGTCDLTVNHRETAKDCHDDAKNSSLTILGLEKYEILALLVTSCMALMSASLISMEAVTRITNQPVIHTGRLGLGAILGLVAHLGTIFGYRDAALEHVVCKALPCPTLKGYNPILGGNLLGAAILEGAHVLIQNWGFYAVDTAAAFTIVGLTVTSMLPLAFYTASVILQKLPYHMSEQLDKCLREALNVDGVLEFRNERFWTKSFGKLAGTLQVRIRSDADENHVLENVVGRLSKIVSTLTVQEFRENRFPATSGTELPAEYYINELLPADNSNRKRSCEEKSRKSEDEVRIIKIDDILRVEPGSFETFELLPAISKSNGFYSVDKFKKNLTIDCNDNVQLKDYLYRESVVQNALLQGMRIDLNNFSNCTIYSEDAGI